MRQHSPFSLLRTLLLDTPEDAWWTSLLYWVIRLTTFSLLLRTYLIPWILSLVSRHIRVRSVSIWSIRGLYIRKGTRIYRVDRISYGWSKGKGINVRLTGLNMEIGRSEPKVHSPTLRGHSRKLTLADFAPSPMAYRFRELLSDCYSLVEPIFRPLIRTGVVACLRLVIRWLPYIIGSLAFDLQSTSFTFTEFPDAKIYVEGISFNAQLSFTQLEKVMDVVDNEKMPRSLAARRLTGMAAWKRRFTDSFQRSLDRAWGKAQGNASISLKFLNLVGSMHPRNSEVGDITKFLRLPGAVDFEASIGFNPREGSADTHSLRAVLDIGDCFVKLDTLYQLLECLKRNQPPSPSSSGPSPASFSIPNSPLVLSSTPSSVEIFPPNPSPPPLNSALVSPVSPTSPFLEVLTASMRPRRRYLHQPCTRLKDTKNTSLMSVLKSATISVSSITVSARPTWGAGPYEIIIQDVTLGSNLIENPSDDAFYQQWLGRNRNFDCFDPDSYNLLFSIQQVTMDRRTQMDSLRILTLGKVAFKALATQWPAPWLVASPFMCGDPNAPLLAVRAEIEGVDFTERVECLRDLVAHLKVTTQEPRVSPNPNVQLSYRVPRLGFEVRCGTIRGRLICGNPRESDPTVLELRNNGFILSLSSSFGRDRSRNSRWNLLSNPDQLSLRMDYKISLIFDPTLIRVRPKSVPLSGLFTSLRSSDAEFLHDPPVVSVECLEIKGAGHAIASLKHDADTVAILMRSSPVLDLHCSTDVLCVELWHPSVMEAIHQVFSIVPSASRLPEPSHSLPLFDRLPGGVSLTMTIARLVVFVTAPDINPLDTMDLSRGFAFRTCVAVQYACMYASHAHRFHDLHHRTETRHKLYLPREKIVDAVAAARTSGITKNVSAHIGIDVSNLSLRSTVATQYDADDPMIAERDDPSLGHQEFLHISKFRINLALSGKRGHVLSTVSDTCDISGEIPHIRATFHLAHVYSALLAIQTIHTLQPVSTPGITAPRPSVLIPFNFKFMVNTLQVMWVLPKENLVTRIDGINVKASTHEPVGVQLNKAVVWVKVPSQLNRWEENVGERWEELLSLQRWNISLPLSTGNMDIAVDGDSARLRIPHGYIFSELIIDTSVTVKALRHLARVAVAGHYTDMPAPESEGPKSMPNISLRVRYLCLEAADDPFETKLAIIWRCGLEAAKHRREREDAFAAKVAAIYQAESKVPIPDTGKTEADYQFGAAHSVSVQEARRRLDEVHALDWTLRLQNHKDELAKAEDIIGQRFHRSASGKGGQTVPNIISVSPIEQLPPLFRATFNGLSLVAQPPSFPTEQLADFLYDRGNGLPRDSEFSLLVPMHLNFTLSSLHITLRDYPLPLFSIPPHRDSSVAALEFDTDIVIAEEMGTDSSVDWIDCPILGPNHGVHGSSQLTISVPKTIMPVKSYANPVLDITASSITTLSWGVSYTPATQDLMRIIETLSSTTRDPSPAIGFWDKLRLIFHWSLVASFKGEVHVHMKGSRNPYEVTNSGSGFVLSFQGNTKWLVGHKNEDDELIQAVSDSLFIAIPDLQHLFAHGERTSYVHHVPETSKPFRKICAKLRSGVRFGIGFALERTCSVDCALGCTGTSFQRKCRHFNFRPHYEVILEKKPAVPLIKGPDDSFNLFRSDFIHLSISLASSTRSPVLGSHHQDPSSLHLTPKSFAHFWSWCSLFDSVLSLPIRQGSYYPPRPISPKLGRHLATLKYRIHLRRLFIMHAYMDESRETWADGVLPWVGVKGMIDEFQVDMHQRDEESTIPGLFPNTLKVIRRKPLYAAEVVLRGLDMRATLAIFEEPLRPKVQMTAPSQRSNYMAHQNLLVTDPSSHWCDKDDFVETDWIPLVIPKLHLLPVVTCPHFTYFKRNSTAPGNTNEASKFGVEQSHTCLLGKEPSVPQVQIIQATARISEIRKLIRARRSNSGRDQDRTSLEKMVNLLENYIALLQQSDKTLDSKDAKLSQSYLLPSYTVSPDEWAEFENVYQIHCPKIYMDSAIRDIMMQYYYCSRARRGLEYHMSTRAVKFIRDQAKAALAADLEPEEDEEKTWGNSKTAQMAASTLRKMLGSDQPKLPVEISTDAVLALDEVDPLNGWSDGVSLRKSHCCLLLKPQIVMRGEGPKDVCIVAAVQAKLSSFAIMDDSNADDPISGKVMSRSYTSVSGLQTFSPATKGTSPVDGCVPYEVLIDLRCESNDFDRLVPQTDATFHYDKFNRLRLRNNITSTVRGSTEKSSFGGTSHHLQDQTDLIRVHIPQFTVSANDEHFQAISHIVTKLLLFSDAAHKTRLDKLETLLFTYDFTDLESAADVVTGLQNRLEDALETQKMAENSQRARLQEEEGQMELLKLKAHIFLLSEELNFLFDAIKLAQDRFDDHTDQKSALLLHASSSEISWKMLDDHRDLLSKLVVQDIDFYWLNRQDSSTGNNLTVGNLQAFDGSRHALWAEILSKHDEPANHPLLKRGLFLSANWTILAPVGGITIYEYFELSLHPLRLQIDARVGRRIMEYLWPARKDRQGAIDDEGEILETQLLTKHSHGIRTSLDSPRALHGFRHDTTKELAPPVLRKLGSSRSFTDLRSRKDTLHPPSLSRMHSTETLRYNLTSDVAEDRKHKNEVAKRAGDAAEMKTRATQKSFVLVRISSLNLLLSIVKEGSFECHDARIRTRDLEYRNQTWSFEELVNQFIPSDMSWRGWVKMAFHQPLLPVLPVARELISKTKWIASSSKAPSQVDAKGPPPKLPRAKVLSVDDNSKLELVHKPRSKSKSPHRGWRKAARRKPEVPIPNITTLPLTDEPESFEIDEEKRPTRSVSRKRMMSLFARRPSSSKGDSSYRTTVLDEFSP
ncbi:golgi-body localization protein domain-containing protein [Collybia nuda]|uniref:Golgi-body localization protein domain-containing protein n=1 Tax=Collybia nuda TaxID=64659 RepID=A0A9P6CL23_9AGAR|nr:golgi-body localization protein domain-containing protein [Collybia nuda]